MFSAHLFVGNGSWHWLAVDNYSVQPRLRGRPQDSQARVLVHDTSIKRSPIPRRSRVDKVRATCSEHLFFWRVHSTPVGDIQKHAGGIWALKACLSNNGLCSERGCLLNGMSLTVYASFTTSRSGEAQFLVDRVWTRCVRACRGHFLGRGGVVHSTSDESIQIHAEGIYDANTGFENVFKCLRHERGFLLSGISLSIYASFVTLQSTFPQFLVDRPWTMYVPLIEGVCAGTLSLPLGRCYFEI